MNAPGEQDKRLDKIIRGSGFTASERYLQRLSDKTFLKLWTYSNTFSGRKKNGGDGKEICDLLVVYGDDVIVFSDNRSAGRGVTASR